MTDELVSLRLADLAGKVGQLTKAVSAVADQQQSLQRKLHKLRDEVRAHIEAERLARNRQYALTALTHALAEHDRKFGQHETVRRSALAVVQAIEVASIGPADLLRTAGELAAGTPEYWLAPALTALAAWTAGESAQAERAAQEAARRDPGRSALFFCLALARSGRPADAARWFACYLGGQDCRSLGEDFAAVLDLTAQGALGPSARAELTAACAQWSGQLARSEDLAEAPVKAWQAFIEARSEQIDGFGLLAKLSPGWTGKQAWLDSAAAFGSTARWAAEVLAATAAGDDPAAAADGLLRDVIAAAGQDERGLLDNARHWQSVLDRDDGSQEPEPAPPADVRASASGPDLLMLATLTATCRDRGRSGQAARFALLLSRDLIKQAIDTLAASARAGYPASITITVDGWSHAIRPGDSPAAARQEYAVFAHEQMVAALDQAAARKRRLLARSPARPEDIRAESAAASQRGQDAVYRAVAQANAFYQRWQQELEAARQCAQLLSEATAWPTTAEPSTQA